MGKLELNLLKIPTIDSPFNGSVSISSISSPSEIPNNGGEGVGEL